MKSLPLYIGAARSSERLLAEAFKVVGDRHQNEFEVREGCRRMAEWSRGHFHTLGETATRYGESTPLHPEYLRSALFHGARFGGAGLLQDLQDLLIMANSTHATWVILNQAAKSLGDAAFAELCTEMGGQSERQIAWLKTRIKHVAPQTLTVPPNLVEELRASIPKKPAVATIPDPLWVPLTCAAMVFVMGLLSVLLKIPLLFVSIGPTLVLQAESPAHPSSRAWNVIAGHLIGILAGFAGVALLNAWDDPIALQDKMLTWGRVLAAVVAVGGALLVMLLLHASHPPALASTLLVALGSIQQPRVAALLLLSVVTIALLGEGVRRVRRGYLTAAGLPATAPTAEPAGPTR